MKMKQILALCLMLALLLTSCAQTPIQETASVNPAADAELIDLLRVIIPMYPYDYDEQAFTAFNVTLRKLGFALAFEPYIVPPVARGINNEAEYEAYLCDVEEYIRQNLAENAAFIVNQDEGPPWGAAWLTDGYLQHRQEFIYGGLVGDFIDVDEHFTAVVRARFGKDVYPNDPGTMYFIPIGCLKTYPRIPAALVREDVAVKYGEVRTASEYIELLRYLKERDPGMTPGVSLMTYDLPFDFLLPDTGFWTFENRELLHRIGSNMAYPLYAIPEGRSIFEETVRLWREGLLILSTGYAHVNADGTSVGFPATWAMTKQKDWEDFPTVLLHAYDFLDPPDDGKWVFDQFDASGYRMYTLYNGVLPVLEGEESYFPAAVAYAGADAGAEALITFLNWLTDRAHYMQLFYGEEDIDYTLIRGQAVPLDPDDPRKAVRDSFLKYFWRADFKQWIIPPFAPNNYAEELTAFSFAYELSLPADGSVAIRGDDWEAFLEARYAGELIWWLSDPMMRSVGDEEDKQAIDDFLSRQKELSHLFEAYADEMNRLIEDAEVR